MTLVAEKTFAEYYESLISREIPPSEYLKNVIRQERSERRILRDAEWDEFRDMLHIAGIWISEKKEAEKGYLPKLTDDKLAVWKKEREIWFPVVAPRPVLQRSNRVVKGYPHNKARKIIEDEVLLREWLMGVEEQIFTHIASASKESLIILTCIDNLRANEVRGRTRVETEEQELFASIRKSVFLKAPSDFFRQKVIERYGESKKDNLPLTFEEKEELAREKILQQEADGWKQCTSYFEEVFKTYFFMLHHQEICERQELEAQQRETLYNEILQGSRRSFGLLYYHTPAFALHGLNHCPCLIGMATAVIKDMHEREEAVRKLFRASP